jgi:hypothetical protein
MMPPEFKETVYLDHWEVIDGDAETGKILATFAGDKEKDARKAFEALKSRSGRDALHLFRRYAVVWQEHEKR